MDSSLAPSLPSLISGDVDESLGDDMEQIEKEYFREILMEQGVIGKEVEVGSGSSEDDSTLESLGAHIGALHKFDIPHDIQTLEDKSQLKTGPLPTTNEKEENEDRKWKAESAQKKKSFTESGRISKMLSSSSIRRLLAALPLNKQDKGREPPASFNSDMENNEVFSAESGSVGKMLSCANANSTRGVKGESREKSKSCAISFSGRISEMVPSLSSRFRSDGKKEDKNDTNQKNAEYEEPQSNPTTPQCPTKYNKPISSLDKESDDRSVDRITVPETPPGFRGFIEIPGNIEDDDDSESYKQLLSMRQKYKIAGCLALFLVIALIVCGITFASLRKETHEVKVTPEGFDNDTWDWTFKPTQQYSAPPSVSALPTSTPTAKGPTILPSASPTQFPTPSPSATPTELPSVQPSMGPTMPPTVTPIPTQMPSASPTFTTAGNFTTIMSKLSPSTVDKINNPYTVQNSAFRWIIEDDLYFTYSEDRIIQRWVMALFAMELSPTSDRRKLVLQENSFEGWTDYTDECTWATSNTDRLVECDGTGVLRNLIVKNGDLDGKLPTELYLLTSLRQLVLTGHREMRGFLDGRIGSMQQLEELVLSHNNLSGTIPSQIGMMKGLKYVDLTANKFTGPIPKEISGLEKLTSLDLRNNELTGTIPEEIALIPSLQNIELSENHLTGTVPSIVCSSLVIDSFSTDCFGEVECSCCTSCESDVTPPPSIPLPTGEPSNNPTPYPTLQPTPTPTRQPTRPPTQGPTESPSLPQPSPEPTPRPTRGPTSPPTTGPTAFSAQSPTEVGPTPYPTLCYDLLEPRRSCFGVAQPIEIEFGNCDALGDDFIGLYSASADPKSLHYPLLWLWTCGDQNCRQLMQAGNLEFGSSSEGISSWPVAEGRYKVYLIRNNNFGGPYQGFKESREIEVSNNC